VTERKPRPVWTHDQGVESQGAVLREGFGNTLAGLRAA
jgi:hypothetical protein